MIFRNYKREKGIRILVLVSFCSRYRHTSLAFSKALDQTLGSFSACQKSALQNLYIRQLSSLRIITGDKMLLGECAASIAKTFLESDAAVIDIKQPEPVAAGIRL
ncbi:hypothetical protein QYF36_005314 [Acer negundo]|nr:hypothetical protein QYF36_005314 [Acer negundo]